jgi:hypothetical protein
MFDQDKAVDVEVISEGKIAKVKTPNGENPTKRAFMFLKDPIPPNSLTTYTIKVLEDVEGTILFGIAPGSHI